MTQELLELKQYAFAQYWGQKVLMLENYLTSTEVSTESMKYVKTDCFLHLRPLSSITDQEKEAYMVLGNDNLSRYLDGLINTRMKIEQVDYLRQQGIALPIYFKGVQYSVERLQELGIYGQFKS